jgi:hypothetical protein
MKYFMKNNFGCESTSYFTAHKLALTVVQLQVTISVQIDNWMTSWPIAVSVILELMSTVFSTAFEFKRGRYTLFVTGKKQNFGVKKVILLRFCGF